MDILFVLIAVSPAVIVARYDLKGQEFLWKSFITKAAGWFYGITFANFIVMYFQGMGEFDFTVLSLKFLTGYMIKSIAAVMLVLTGRKIWTLCLHKKESQKAAVDVVRELLYLLGAGVLSRLIQKRFLSGSDKKESIHMLLLEILAYGMLNMFVTIGILKPMGRVQAGFFEGKFFIQYGASAWMASAVFAVTFGYAGAILAERKTSCRQLAGMIFTRIKGSKNILAYMSAAAISAYILVFVNVSTDQWADMDIYEEQLMIGGKMFDSSVPVYCTKESEYFIPCRELAHHLDLKYEEKIRPMFRSECRIGNNEFAVNVLSPGENFYVKDSIVYVRLSYLEQETELLYSRNPKLERV